MIKSNKILALQTVCLIFWCNCSPRLAAGQNVTVGNAVPVSQLVSMDQIDHSIWNSILEKYVDEQGRVDYQGLTASTEDRESLDRYLKLLSTASRSAPASRESTLAFWINAYNAVTVVGIVREYPTSSIRNHTAKLFGYNIWKNLLLQVGDSTISLHDIEHEVLRKMQEPRIHFAIVCASHSCPRLLNQAYTSKKLESQLMENSKAFFANPENFRHDRELQRFEVSAIMDWYAEDFGVDQAAQLTAIARFLPTADAQVAAAQNSVSVAYLEYDWSLNEQPPSEPKK